MTRDADSPIDRVFAILNVVAQSKKPLAISEIAEELDIPLPSAHRLVGNLEARMLLQRALGTKRFTVGNQLVTLAAKTISTSFRTARRHAVLQSLSEKIGEQCEIGLVRNNRVVYVDSVRVASVQGLQFDPGSDAPLHCTSTGKIYLSLMPTRAREKLVNSLELVRYTPNTVTDHEDLMTVLNQTKRQGWAASNEEFVSGVVGCAVPIVTPKGDLIACLGVSVPTARVSFGKLSNFVPHLLEAAEVLSETVLGEQAEFE
ncbi:IclR family transcriptional regulator [Pseudooceanicola onchidii]|uniref:IclR family transcriptional regulator n=1 Tax=Pseudooceanicola onchidii TaxID=2562279 RepID=UPI0010AB4798|nr:IclR family transcriptional regulator [Pseudooceanicola onchidii]